MDDVIQHDPNYRDAQLERLTVLYRTCTTQRQSGARTASFATVELGLRDSDALFSLLPNDLDVVEYAVVFPLARLRQLAANLPGAAEDVAKAQSLLQQMLAARPESREVDSNLVAAYARMGAIQAELGAREKAFANYRTGVVELKAQVARFPGRYSHVGDVLGHPAFKNNGNTVGALNVKRRMVDLAESVFQVDSSNVCARSDLGILCASASFSLEPISAPFSRGRLNSFLSSWQKPPKTTPAPP